MIHIPINGLIRTISLLFLLSSCSIYKNHFNSGQVYKGFNTFYVNDKFHYSIALHGDYFQSKKRQASYKNLKVINMKRYKSNLIEMFTTRNTPHFEFYLFQFNSMKEINDCISNCIDDSEVEFESDSTILFTSTDKKIIGKGMRLENDSFILALGVLKNESIKDSTLINREFESIFNSVRTDDSYNMILPNPFTDAIASDQSQDSVFNYVKPVAMLLRNEPLYQRNIFNYVQVFCNYASRISEFNLFDQKFDEYKSFFTKKKTNQAKIIDNKNVLKSTIELIKDERLVMFNENHFDIRHRIHVDGLLKELYENGFRYIGLEALWEEETELMERGFPTTKSGFYVCEPSMGNLIRNAIDLGFTVFGYDDAQSDGNRESYQAETIYNKTFAKDSSAKVIILGGHSHIWENDESWMAHYFRERYKINPLTITQTELYDTQDSIVLYVDGNKTDYSLYSDLSIKNTYDLIGREAKEIPLEISWDAPIRRNNILVVQVYNATEYSEDIRTVPVAVINIQNDQETIHVHLKKGKYIYFLRNGSIEILEQGEFQIE